MTVTQEGTGGPGGLCPPTQGTQARSHLAVRIHTLWVQLSLVPPLLSVGASVPQQTRSTARNKNKLVKKIF